MSEKLTPEAYRRLENIPEPRASEHQFLMDAEEMESYLETVTHERLSGITKPELLETAYKQEVLNVYRVALRARGESNYFGMKAVETNDPAIIETYYQKNSLFREALNRYREMKGEKVLAYHTDTIEKKIKRWWPSDSEHLSKKWGHSVTETTDKLIARLLQVRKGPASEKQDAQEVYYGSQEGAKGFAVAAMKEGDHAPARAILSILSTEFDDGEARELLEHLP